MSDKKNTQPTSASGYDVSRMIFSKPQEGKVPNSNPPIKYHRINIGTVNEDGTSGNLIIPTERLFSFGVSENRSNETKKITGYSLSLACWNKDKVTQKEKDFTETIANIAERCKDYMMENKDELGQYDLERSELKKFNPLYWKREKGKIVKGRGPTLYVKLITQKPKKDDKNDEEEEKDEEELRILSMFYDPQGNDVDALALKGKYCYVRAAIKVESIFIGSKISLQIKLYEAEVEMLNGGMKRLLRPKVESKVQVGVSNVFDALNEDDDDDDDEDEDEPVVDDNDGEDDEGSVKAESTEEDEPEPEPVKPKKKRVVKRVVRKKRST